MATLDATPGGVAANSYLTLAEANDYFTMRAVPSGWESADDQSKLLMWATRHMDISLSGYRTFVPPNGSVSGYYRISSRWSGLPSSATQALAWPRIGMFDRNGNAIATNVVPRDLKYAVAELAAVLGTKDITVDDANAMQGITSVAAGSVSVSFAQGAALSIMRILPQGVVALLVPSWVLPEENEGMYTPMFGVI